MPRPTDPANVAASSAATSSWANSVVDAILAILDDIYGVTDLAIPWASVTGKPATFAPVLANATAATTYGLAKVDGVSTSGARADHIHGTPALPTGSQLSMPTTYNTPATATTRRIYVGSATPTGASDGDLWFVTP